jgi:signal transduction histidine kinase
MRVLARQTGNTGLVLAIARILAARQEASLHVDDAAGGGAVFSVRLSRLFPGSWNKRHAPSSGA